MQRSSRPSPAVFTAVDSRELAPAGSLLSFLPELRGDACPWLLDSALEGDRLGRYSFAGADPYLVIRAFGHRIELDGRRAVRPDVEPGRVVCEGDPLALARRWMPPAPSVDASPLPLPFVGGAIALFGYELADAHDRLELHGRDDLGLPDMVLLFVDRLLALDHASRRVFAVGLGFGATLQHARAAAARSADDYAKRFGAQRLGPSAGVARPGPTAARSGIGESTARRRVLATELPAAAACSIGESAYAARVLRLKREITAGNVYEANLTRRLSLPHTGDAWDLYLALRRENPAPFAAFIELPDGAVIGSSPERFLRVDAGGAVESRPIKGTRPRGASDAEDAALRAELEESEKDRAENLMIVDLVRNDLGRVCAIGSVRVPELMAIETYASVFQMVSTVTGQLAEGRDALDLVQAAFPPGSMTGAPKHAAMRLLSELEPVRRGLYAGAVGYLDVRGGLDLSVVIRTILLTKGHAHLHVGGAIVADSEPQLELRETLDKARALLAALESAGR